MSQQHMHTESSLSAHSRDQQHTRSTRYLDVLRRLARTADADILQYQHITVFEVPKLVDSSCSGNKALLQTVAAHASHQLQDRLCNMFFSMNMLIERTRQSSVLEGCLIISKDLDSICSTLADLSGLLHKLTSLDVTSADDCDGLRFLLPVMTAGTGFITLLVHFTEWALTELKHQAGAATALDKQYLALQKQPQHQHHQQLAAAMAAELQRLWSKHYLAVSLFKSLCRMWLMVVSQAPLLLHSCRFVQQAISVAARLSATTVPLLSSFVMYDHRESNHAKSASTISTSSSGTDSWKGKDNSIDVIARSQITSSLTHLTISLSIVLVEFVSEAITGCKQQHDTSIKWFTPTRHFESVMLMALINPAAGLHRARIAAERAAVRNRSAEQRQGIQAACNGSVADAAAGVSGSDTRQRAGTSAPCAVGECRVLQSHKVCLASLGLFSDWQPIDYWEHAFAPTSCERVLASIKTLLTAAVANQDSHRSSNSKAGSIQQAEQQQTECEHQRQRFPCHMLQPMFKLLLETMLLLPAHHTSLQVSCLELMWLLVCTATEGKPSAARDLDSYALAASWPVLPAAVAAGLFHPVVQLLSRAVIQALKETEPKQQQQQQQQQLQKGSVTEQDKEDRLVLLQYFGKVLLTVCQAVEPKHIAAALRSDPVIPLVAIEAVIRAQTCHLVPSSNRQPEQQPENVGMILSFVQSVLHALCHMIDAQQSPTASLLTADQDSHCLAGSDLAVRLFSMSITACKTLRAAMSLLASHNRQDPSDANLMLQMPTAAASLGEYHLQLYKWLKGSGLTLYTTLVDLAVDWDNAMKATGQPSVRQTTLPIFMMLQAIHVWGAALSSGHPAFRTTGQNNNKDTLVVGDWCCASQSKAAATRSNSLSLCTSETADANTLSVITMLNRTVVHRLCSAFEELDDMSFWKALGSIEGDTDGTSSSDKHRQSQSHMEYKRMTLVAELKGIGRCVTGSIDSKSAADEGSSTHGISITSLVPSAMERYGMQLQTTVAEAIAEFPIPFCCNNPGCVNLSKLSEYQLVSGEACVCGGCKVARYCSRECQKKHWKPHKVVCNRMQQVSPQAQDC